MPDKAVPKWLAGLEEEDFQFIKRFVLASGSLKEMAQVYGVSYPTIRLRLDRLIEKVRILDEPGAKTPFHQQLRLLVTEGRIEQSVARKLLRAFTESSPEEDEK